MVNSECVSVTVGPTGVDDLISGAISVFPNPVNDQLQISSNERVPFSVFNSIGSMVYNGILTPNATLDVSLYTAGIYYIRTLNGAVVRFVKQ